MIEFQSGPIQLQFDHLADGYQRGFDVNILARWARHRAWALYRDHLPPAPAHLLDLGCGPGADAVALARIGYTVTAVDYSPRMLDEARDGAHRAGVSELIRFVNHDFTALEPLAVPINPASMAIMGFGVLNSFSDIHEALGNVRELLLPGGVLVVSSLSNKCIWDVVWHAFQGRRAPRWGARQLSHRVGEISAPEWYWTASDIGAAGEKWFEVVDCIGIGSIAPPPYAAPRFAQFPRLLKIMWNFDRLIERNGCAVQHADMVWMSLMAK